MRILITGATGFVGTNLIYKIFSDEKVSKHEYALLNRNNQKSLELFKQFDNIINIDMKKENFKDEIKKFNPEFVIHLAAFSTSKDDEESIEKLIDTNIKFGAHLLDVLQYTDMKIFVSIGTFAEYLDNDEAIKNAYLYSATKTAYRAIVDYYMRKGNFKWVNAIPYTIYGGKNNSKKVIDYVIDSLDSKEKISMTPGMQCLDFIHVYDVCNFFIKLIGNYEKLSDDYTEFYLGTGKGTQIKEMASLVEKIFEGTLNINWGGLKYRKMDVMKAIAPIDKNLSEINWKAQINLEEGIKMMLENRRERENETKCN